MSQCFLIEHYSYLLDIIGNNEHAPSRRFISSSLRAEGQTFGTFFFTLLLFVFRRMLLRVWLQLRGAHVEQALHQVKPELRAL